jgi:hypothetical protein
MSLSRAAGPLLFLCACDELIITFGDKDRDLLFITASKTVYGLKMRVKGAR